MTRLYPLAVFVLVGTAIAAPEAGESVATLGKTGKFLGVGTIRDPRPKPASNGDLQSIRWEARDGFERVVFHIHENDFGAKETPPLNIPGRYRINNETFPCRIVCEFNARQASGFAAMPGFSKSLLVSGISPLTILDDALLGFAIDLRRPTEIEVFELHDPARIVIDIRASKDGGVRFSARTPGMKGGEPVGHLEERLMAEGIRNVRQLRCADGSVCLELGNFLTEAEASAIAERVAAAGISVLVEKRGINDLPKAPEDP